MECFGACLVVPDYNRQENTSFLDALKIVFTNWRAETDAVFTVIQGQDRQENAGWRGQEARRCSA